MRKDIRLSVLSLWRSDMVKFALVGGVTAVIQLAAYAAMIKLSVNYEVASLISMTLSTTLAYIGNRLWTFRSDNGWVGEFLGFAITRIVTIILNALLLYVLVQFLRVNKMAAQVLSIVVVTVLNYLVGKFLVFAPKRMGDSEEAAYVEVGGRRDG